VRTVQHTLILLRHAKAADIAPGLKDIDRPLAERGRQQAGLVAEALEPERIDQVLCSPSARTRQTLAPVLEHRRGVQVDYVDAIYNAGVDTLLALLHEVGEDVATLLMVGHGPGIPGLVYELADQHHSEPAALTSLEHGYPTATIAQLTVTSPWADLATARLELVWTPTA